MAQKGQGSEKRIWTKFNEETTMHGFRHMNESAKIRKIIWLIMIIVCSAYLIYQCWHKWADFQKGPINTNMDIQYPSKLHFPAVAICNTNQFRISYMRNRLYNMITDLYSTGQAEVQTYNFTAYRNEMNDLQQNSHDLLNAAGPSIEDMLLVCRWPDGTKCTANDFVKLTTDFGICYAINTNAQKPMTVNRAGVHSGVYMLLNIESYERMGSPTTAIGLKILIYNQTSLPMISLDGIDLPPGFLSQLGISMQEKQKLPTTEGGTCASDEALTYFNKIAQEYSVEKCKIDKKIGMIEEKCKCLPFYVPLYNVGGVSKETNMTNSNKLCGIEDHFSCVVAQETVPEAASNCKENCTTITFKPFLSMSKLPTTSLESVIGFERNERMFEHYKHSMEARHRVQTDKLFDTQKEIMKMQEADQAMRNLKYRPFLDEFRGVYQNFIESVPCFRGILTTYGEPLNHVDTLKKELATRGPDSIVPFGKIIRYLFPNRTTEDLITNWSDLESEAENITSTTVKEVKETLMNLFEVLAFYNEEGYISELDGDIQEYKDIFTAIDEFENETITKLAWAQRTIKLKHMEIQMQTLMNRLLANVINIDKINKDKRYIDLFARIDNGIANETLLSLIEHNVFQQFSKYN